MLVEIKGIRNTQHYIRLDKVDCISIQDDGHAFVRMGSESFQIQTEEARRVVGLINNQAASKVASQPAPEPQTTVTEIVAMTRDVTKSGGAMWRCATKRGFMVNVFQHDDPLKDTFTLFVSAGYAPEMSALEPGETINWTKFPIDVELKANGSFWNVVSVKDRPADVKPDVLTPDDDDIGD